MQVVVLHVQRRTHNYGLKEMKACPQEAEVVLDGIPRGNKGTPQFSGKYYNYNFIFI